MTTQDALTPRPEHRFTFGLWTVGNPGRDPFGAPDARAAGPGRLVRRLAEIGAWGVSLHDKDLVPYGSSAAERDRIVARFAAALEETGLGVGMATTNLFSHPAFKDGAFTSNDRRRATRGDRQGDDVDRPRRRARRGGVRVLGRARGDRGRYREGSARRARALPRGDRRALRVRDRAGLRHAVRDGAQAERAARRPVPADRRARAALHHHAAAPGDGRGEPGGGARDDGGAVVPPRRRARRCGPASCSTST